MAYQATFQPETRSDTISFFPPVSLAGSIFFILLILGLLNNSLMDQKPLSGCTHVQQSAAAARLAALNATIGAVQ